MAHLISPAGALQAAAWHHGALLGLVFAALLGAVLGGEGVETGTWSLARLHQASVVRGLLWKIAAVLTASCISVLVTWAALWGSAQLFEPPTPPPHVTWAQHITWQAAPVGWAETAESCSRAVLALSVYAALGVCAAAATRVVIAGAAVAVGGMVVTMPLVTTGIRSTLPHYWIAAWMEFPGGAQWELYWWSSSPIGAGIGVPLTVMCALLLLLLAAAWLLLRGERALTPRA
ncbi:hypothetical protein [Streptomyces sannanensis]